MRICIDLDGVLCEVKGPDESYADVRPIAGAAEALATLRRHGHTVIINTARHMKSTDGNVGLVLARVGPVTLNWLEAHGMEYDEIHFGKPFADLYIDDNALRFTTWSEIDATGEKLPVSTERRFRGDSA